MTLGWVAIGGFLTSCQQPRDPDLLATYEGGEVRTAELDEMLRSLPAAKRRPPEGSSLPDWIEERIGDLVLPEVLLRRAESAAWANDPALDLRVRYLAGQDVGRVYLAEQCPQEEVSEEDLRALFARVGRRKPRPWILLRHIFKRGGGPGESDGVRRELEALRQEILAGASFLELARQHSDSNTAEEGGLIGRISRQAPMEPKVLQAAWSLEDGSISEIVEVENGFHLLFRESSGIEAAADFDELRGRLAEQESLRRRELCGRDVLRRLGEKTPARLEATLLAPTSPEEPVLWVGEEPFNSVQLAGITADGVPLALSPRPRELVRHLVESLLLTAAFVEEMPDQATSLEETLRQTRSRLLIEARWKEEREQQVLAEGEEALQRIFAAQPERFFSDLEIDLGLILVRSAGPGQRRAAFEKTLALRRRIEAGESFEELAREVSEHPSAEAGGRLGLLSLPRLRIVLGSQAIDDAAALAVGEVSAPVTIQEAPVPVFALLEVYERHEPRARAFEEAREDLIATLAKDRVRQLDEEVRSRVFQEVGLTIFPEVVAGYLDAGAMAPRASDGAGVGS